MSTTTRREKDHRKVQPCCHRAITYNASKLKPSWDSLRSGKAMRAAPPPAATGYQHHQRHQRHQQQMQYHRDSASTYSTSSSGVCMMSNNWRDEQHPSFMNFISSFLHANSFRLNNVPIVPDFIFNCGGLSVAFVFVTSWDTARTSLVYRRVMKLKEQFANLYVVVTLPTSEQNESFVRSYFKSRIYIGRPTFVPVKDFEMGFEKIVKIAHARGVCKRQDAVNKMKSERKQAVQGMDAVRKVVTSIPGLDSHDANSVSQAIGSIEAIAKASEEQLLESTDLSADKVETIVRFFRDPKFYLSPKLN